MAGESILGGTIYVKGEVPSLGKNAVLEEAGPEELETVNEELSEHGFEKSDSFSKIVPADG